MQRINYFTNPNFTGPFADINIHGEANATYNAGTKQLNIYGNNGGYGFNLTVPKNAALVFACFLWTKHDKNPNPLTVYSLESSDTKPIASATISQEVMTVSWMYQRDEVEITVEPKQEDRPDIDQFSITCTPLEKAETSLRLIRSQGYERVMIFCNTKYNTGMLANQLARLNFNVDCLHGDLSQAERNRIMTRFKAGEIDVLVATDVAARGIDVSDVDAVINYDVPEENEHYTHRIGRTGRARKQGASYLFYTKEEQKRVDQLLRLTRNTDDCKSVKFDFNHEHLKIEDTAPADKFQIKAYF